MPTISSYKEPLINQAALQRQHSQRMSDFERGRIQNQLNKLEAIDRAGENTRRNTELQIRGDLKRQGLTNEGQLAVQGLSNKGSLANIQANNAGAYSRQGLANQGSLDIANINQTTDREQMAANLFGQGAISGDRAYHIGGNMGFLGAPQMQSVKTTKEFVPSKIDAEGNQVQQAGVFDKSTGIFTPDYTQGINKSLGDLRNLTDPIERAKYLEKLWQDNPGAARALTRQLEGE